MARDVIAAPEDRAFLLVATDDAGEVVGFALNQWKWSSLRGAQVVVMDDLFVAESARGGGHADALIEAVADVARRHGAPIISWFTMPDNEARTPPRRCSVRAASASEQRRERRPVAASSARRAGGSLECRAGAQRVAGGAVRQIRPEIVRRGRPR